jgi:hypothetical protein
MAVSRLSQQSLQNAFPKGNTVWDGTTATSAFDSLGTVVLTSSTSSVTFSSIPATYTHLHLQLSAKANRATYVDDLGMRFNGDSTGLYSYHRLYSFGSGTPGADAGASQTSMDIGQIAGGTVNNAQGHGGVLIDVLDYTNTNKYKTVRALSGYDDNAQGAIQLASGNYRSFSVISGITFIPLIGTTFSQYSTFSLFGVK